MTVKEYIEFFRANWRRDDGQTMAEYGVVLAVLTVGAIGVFTALSGGVEGAIGKVTGVIPK